MAQYIFPKLDIPHVKRSNFDLSCKRSTTFAPGTLIPIYMKEVLPHDRFVIDPYAGIESFPLAQPTHGTWRANMDWFFCPLSNMYGWMDNDDRRTAEEIMNTDLHQYKLYTDSSVDLEYWYSAGYDYRHFNSVQPGCIYQYLGWPAGYSGSYFDPERPIPIIDDISADRDSVFAGNTFRVESEILNAHKPFAYLDIIRHYYVNPQENYTYFMGRTGDNRYIPSSMLIPVKLDTLDDIFLALRAKTDQQYPGSLAACLNDDIFRYQSEDNTQRMQDISKFFREWEKSYLTPLGGLFVRPYRMDLNRGLMNVDTSDYKAIIDTSGGNTSIENVRFQNRLQETIDLIDVGNGRFSDWTKTIWTIDVKGKLNKPVYLGSRSEIIYSADVIATAGTENTELGQQAGFAVGKINKGRRISFNSDQYGVLVCIFSLTPEVNYSEGFEASDLRTTFLDVYQPQFANVGFVEVPQKELYPFPMISKLYKYMKYSDVWGDFTSDPERVSSVDYIGKLWIASDISHNEAGEYTYNNVVGRRLAFADYMTDVDRSYGLFSEGQSLSSWVLNRTYQQTENNYLYPAITESGEYGYFSAETNYGGSTYIDPFAFNELFADTKANAQNFRLFCKFDILAKRAIPKRVPPHM